MGEWNEAAKPFVLGQEWPDWWADKVTRNEAITGNEDGRWRGGPDYAILTTPRGLVMKRFGDTISPEDFALSTGAKG